MTKSLRFLLVLVFLGLASIFLYPTVKWYFLTDTDMKALANSSREEIRLWAIDQTASAMDDLLTQDINKLDMNIPAQYAFLIDTAKTNYKAYGEKSPDQWTLRNVLNGFRGSEDELRNSHRRSLQTECSGHQGH